MKIFGEANLWELEISLHYACQSNFFLYLFQNFLWHS